MKDDPIDPKTAVPKRPLEGQQIKQRLRGLGDGMENAAAFGLFCQLASGKSKVAMENPFHLFSSSYVMMEVWG